ncbi:hypothetical protein GCM10010336_53810 [Streptomyces goshikiensis]|nr:hypothetical protein GCM10010336_53810 [Streptomyces goshikiensis]
MTSPPRDLVPFPLKNTTRVHRIYPRMYKGRPGKPAWYCDGDPVCRFDTPGSGTCYAASSREGAFIEVFRRFWDAGIPLGTVAQMSHVYMRVIDLHQLADLTDNANLNVMGIGDALALEVDKNYPLSHAFAQVARSYGLDGVHWTSVRDRSGRTNFALFADAGGDYEDIRLIVDGKGPIPDDVVNSVAAEFRLELLPPPRGSYPVRST